MLQACSGAQGFAFLTSSQVMPWCRPGATLGKHAAMQRCSAPAFHTQGSHLLSLRLEPPPPSRLPVPSYPALINISLASLSLHIKTGCLFLEPRCVCVTLCSDCWLLGILCPHWTVGSLGQALSGSFSTALSKQSTRSTSHCTDDVSFLKLVTKASPELSINSVIRIIMGVSALKGPGNRPVS